MKILKHLSLIILVCLLCCCWSSVGYCSTITHEITEVELTQLTNNFSRLKAINKELLTTCQTQKSEVTDLKKELTELKTMLTTSKVRLENQTVLLNNANQLLKQYEAETKAEKRKIRRQRNLAYGLFAVAVVALINK